MTKLIIAVIVAIGPLTAALAASGDIAPGQRDFRACAPCHSLESNRNMTGPSLAGLWGRKAGSLASFERYSDALKSSGIIWDDRSLDAWLTDPQKMVPDNDMPFAGIKDAGVRAHLLAFLREASKPGAQQQMAQQGGMGGGMMGGMMGGGHDPNLKSSRARQAGEGDHLLPRQLSGDYRRRKDARLLGTQRALHDQLQPGWAGQRRARHHARRHDGRPRRGDLRRAGRNQQDDRSEMLITEPAGSTGVATHVKHGSCR